MSVTRTGMRHGPYSSRRLHPERGEGMRKMMMLLVVIAVASFGAVPALAGGRPLTAELTGAAEVPGPGDPDGSGFAKVTLNQGLGEVCWDITFEGIGAPTAAHIHTGEAGVAGGVVVALSPGSDCTDGVDAEVIKAIRQNPSDYYVNVHNAEFPPGALRGQLSK